MDMERLAAQSPWWSGKEAILRDSKVGNVLKSGERIIFEVKEENQVLIGPRQLGKTTALKYDIYRKIIKQNIDPGSVLYYSFDTERNFEGISDVLDTFAGREGRKYIYLDEVSFVDGWQRAIKRFLDSEKAKEATLYVTGSSSANMKKELLPGRNIRFMEFLPLSFRDFLISFGSEGLRRFLKQNRARSLDDAVGMAGRQIDRFGEISRWFDAYVDSGGYPDAIFDHLKNGRVGDEIYDIHWNAFISDVSKLGKSAEIATAVISGILESYSSKVNLLGIARMQGVKSHVTVREYIEDFDSLFVSKSIFPIAGKRYAFRKERKVYFNDPFLYNMFANKVKMVDKEKEPKVVEGIAYNHLYRFVNRGKGISEPKTTIGFCSGKREVDFATGSFGLEVKWRNDVGPEDFPDAQLKNKILLSKKTLDLDAGRNVRIVPLPLFLSAL